MNNVDILFEVEREAILHLVKLQSHYMGDIRKAGDDVIVATKMQASDDNDDILNSFIDSASFDISDVLTGILSESRLEKEDYLTEKGFPSVRFVFYTSVPKTFDANQNESILNGIKGYMTNYALWEWFKITNPKEAEAFLAECTKLKGKIIHRINQRTKPIRRPIRPMGF